MICLLLHGATTRQVTPCSTPLGLGLLAVLCTRRFDVTCLSLTILGRSVTAAWSRCLLLPLLQNSLSSQRCIPVAVGVSSQTPAAGPGPSEEERSRASGRRGAGTTYCAGNEHKGRERPPPARRGPSGDSGGTSCWAGVEQIDRRSSKTRPIGSQQHPSPSPSRPEGRQDR